MVDPQCLLSVCRSCDCLSMNLVDGNEVSVRLIGESDCFVDVCSQHDPYPPELWLAAAEYFQNLIGADRLLPGGRYACACALVTRKLPFLDGRSLGEVCHIVQLGVSTRKILGYVDGNMVPYASSQESVKEHCAAFRQPLSNSTKQQARTWPAATWAEARSCIAEILRSPCTPEPGVVTISNVKRLFRSQFGLDLSETALGFSRLSEVLQDARFHDICTVRARGAGQVVVCRPDRQATGGDAEQMWWAGDLTTGQFCSGLHCLGTMPMQQQHSFAHQPCLGAALGQHDPQGPPWEFEWGPRSEAYGHLSEAPVPAPHLQPGSIAPPPGLPPPSPREVAVRTGKVLAEAVTVPTSSAADTLSSHVQRLLELSSDERQATLRKLSGDVDGSPKLSPNDGQESSRCRPRSSSVSTAACSDHSDVVCCSMLESSSSD